MTSPDKLDDEAFSRAWDEAIREDAARRAARLPSRPIPTEESRRG